MVGSHPLMSYMAFLSEKYLHAGWHDCLEYYVWKHYKEGSRFEIAELAALDRLVHTHQCWFIWPMDSEVPKQISLSEWKELYAEEMLSEASGD